MGRHNLYTAHKHGRREPAQVLPVADVQSEAEAARDASSDSSEAEAAAEVKGMRMMRESWMGDHRVVGTEEGLFIDLEYWNSIDKMLDEESWGRI